MGRERGQGPRAAASRRAAASPGPVWGDTAAGRARGRGGVGLTETLFGGIVAFVPAAASGERQAGCLLL